MSTACDTRARRVQPQTIALIEEYEFFRSIGYTTEYTINRLSSAMGLRGDSIRKSLERHGIHDPENR